MKTTIASTMLLVFAAAAPLAHAAPEVNSAGFTLIQTGGYATVGLQVLSDNGTTVQISLNGAEPAINPLAVSASAYDNSNADFGWTQLGGTVRQGYQITSITVGGVLSGSLDIGQPDIVCGTNCTSYAGAATNSGGAEWKLTRNGNETSTTGQLANVTSPQAFSSTLTGGVDGDFKLDIYTFLRGFAEATQYSVYHNINNEVDWTEELFWTSESSIALSDLTLTVQISPVPEPGTYAMLLTGLGLVGFTARRRRVVGN